MPQAPSPSPSPLSYPCCPQDALQRLDEFRGTPLAPDLLSQRLTDVCLASRAHRDAAAQTPCCVALPVLPLLRLHRLDSCLDWLARRRLADVTLASAGMAHSAATALAAALDRHAPKLRLSSPRLALVAEEAGQVFDAGGCWLGSTVGAGRQGNAQGVHGQVAGRCGGWRRGCCRGMPGTPHSRMHGPRPAALQARWRRSLSCRRSIWISMRLPSWPSCRPRPRAWLSTCRAARTSCSTLRMLGTHPTCCLRPRACCAPCSA